LRVGGIGYDCIRADEATDRGVIIAGAVIVETGIIQALPGELFIRGDRAGGQPCPAEDRELDRPGYVAAGIRHHRGAAQGVLVNVAQRLPLFLGDQLAAEVIGYRLIAGSNVLFVVLIYIDCCLSVFGLDDPVAVTIVDKSRSSTVIRNAYRPVLGIPGNRQSV